MSGMEGEKGRTERKNYSTAISQIHGRFIMALEGWNLGRMHLNPC